MTGTKHNTSRTIEAKGPTWGTIIGVKTYDLRFPTSSTLSGSDAMNKDPDYPRHTSSSPPTRMAA